MRITPHSIGPIHFVGIGGIGMSGIAEILHNLGYVVQGSDMSENANVQRLKKLGVKTFSQHDATQIEGISVLVVSSAIKVDNPEIKAAREKHIPIVRRAEMLAEIMRLKPSVAIAGTHGKTTTTSLVASVLDNAQMDPTVINGGIINAYGTNARLGKGEWIVAEADESDGSFTRLPLTIGIVTNIEPEHLDYYAGLEEIQQAFKTFISHIPFYGLGILCQDDKGVEALLPHLTDRRILTYGFSEKADVQIQNVHTNNLTQTFDVLFTEAAVAKFGFENKEPFTLKEVYLPMIGRHNVSNATAALCVGVDVGIPLDKLVSSFETFKGVKRRFTKVGEVAGLTIIDDYAHHPTEIQAVLDSASASMIGNIIAVVQPHRYTRLSSLMDEFSQSLKGVSHVIVVPVYPAGEREIPGVSSEVLASKIKALTSSPVDLIHHEDELAPLLIKSAKKGSCVICMGAGSITQWAQRLPEALHHLEMAQSNRVMEG